MCYGIAFTIIWLYDPHETITTKSLSSHEHMAMTNYNKIAFLNSFYQAKKLNMHEVVCKDLPKIEFYSWLENLWEEKKLKKTMM